MSLTPAIIDAMVQAGCTAAQLAAAMKADLEERTARAARQIPLPKLRVMALERDGENCAYCSTTEGPFEVDHIVPQIAGGEDILENVIVSCRSCNRAKRDRQGDDWDSLMERRRKDRERKRSSRSGHARNSRDVTVTECDPPHDRYSNPPELSPSEAKASLAPKGKTRKGTRLPDDWQPETLTGEIATAVCAWQPGMLERELARFRDYWTAKSGRTAAKQDWQAAWRNWLRNAEEWTHNGTANRKNTAPRQAGRSPDGFMSALREVADRKPDVSGFEPTGSFSVARLGAC